MASLVKIYNETISLEKEVEAYERKMRADLDKEEIEML